MSILIPWYTGVLPLSRRTPAESQRERSMSKLSEEKRSMPLPRPDVFLVGLRALQPMRYSDRAMNHSSSGLVPVHGVGVGTVAVVISRYSIEYGGTSKFLLPENGTNASNGHGSITRFHRRQKHKTSHVEHPPVVGRRIIMALWPPVSSQVKRVDRVSVARMPVPRGIIAAIMISTRIQRTVITDSVGVYRHTNHNPWISC